VSATKQDMCQAGRVFRVVVCHTCRWQYGAWWLEEEVGEYWGDCPCCGGKTALELAHLHERRSVPPVSAQQELAL